MRYHVSMNNKQLVTYVGFIGALIFVGGVLIANKGREDKLPAVENNITPMQTIEGLQIAIMTEGSGVAIQDGQTAEVDYTGMLIDGTVFDSSVPRKQTFKVHLGQGEVIKGWDLGIVGMKVGEERKLTISPELGYGKNGFPGVIPPNATLIFDVTLKSIQ